MLTSHSKALESTKNTKGTKKGNMRRELKFYPHQKFCFSVEKEQAKQTIEVKVLRLCISFSFVFFRAFRGPLVFDFIRSSPSPLWRTSAILRVMKNKSSLPWPVRAELFSQLATLERAGLSAEHALATINLPTRYQTHLEMMRKALKRGKTIAQAGAQTGVFNSLETALIAAACQAGSPAATYTRLAEQMPDDGLQVLMFTHKDTDIWKTSPSSCGPPVSQNLALVAVCGTGDGAAFRPAQPA